jgi:DNA mismatch repair ATPase MutS
MGEAWPFLAVLLAEIAVVYRLKTRVATVVHAAERGFENLRLLSDLLVRLEREQFGAPALQAVQRLLASNAQPASRSIAQLRSITDFAGQRDNMLVQRVLEIPLLYSVHVALAAESWRSLHGAAVRTWLSATGRLEALSSLAMYAYEHPEYSFAEIVEGTATFEARELGHPLLPAAACVRNDVSIREPIRALLVSGSNMSGKSTLLRAVGVNTVLAMAGAPVRARSLRLTPLQVGASIRISDSLAEGHSRFYAEISRLRELYELSARGTTLLFLLDELLQGTNSKDRRIGAEGVLRGFIERGSIGLISTHDLALTDITGMPAGALYNVHFEDVLEHGRMSFDFKLRDGVVTRSNGIELMRAIGLRV